MMKGLRAGKRFVAMLLTAICLLSIGLPGVAHAANDVTVPIKVRQEFTKTGTDRTVNEMFTYTLTPVEAGNPLPTGASATSYPFTVTGSETKSFNIVFTRVGVYNYQVQSAVSSAQPGYTYDTAVYTLTISVMNKEGGGLKFEAFVKNAAGDKVAEIFYKHAYQPKSVVSVDPPVQKTISGGTPTTASTFTFVLEAQSSTNPMPDGRTGGTKTMTITGVGSKDFGTWTYTATGTYYYRIYESVDVAGYTRDTTIYTITDVVTDNKGQLEVQRTTAYLNGTPANGFTFNNIYNTPTPAPTATPRPGKDGPKTGDETDNTWWIVLLCIAGVAAVCCVIFLILRKKRQDEEKNKAEREDCVRRDE